MTLLFAKAYKARKATEELVQNYKKDRKATITFFLLFLSVVLVTLPNIVILAILDTFYDVNALPPAAYSVSAVTESLIYLLLITDPILIMRNNDIRKILADFKHKILNNIAQKAPTRAVRVAESTFRVGTEDNIASNLIKCLQESQLSLYSKLHTHSFVSYVHCTIV